MKYEPCDLQMQFLQIFLTLDYFLQRYIECPHMPRSIDDRFLLSIWTDCDTKIGYSLALIVSDLS